MATNSENKANLLFDRWKADLKEMDRSRKNVEANFDVLFTNLKDSNISFELAHQILAKAIIAHYPPAGAVDMVYKNWKGMGKTKQEFLEDWKEDISAAAKRAFYSLYEIDGTEKKEEKSYGGMSSIEYRKQLQYAESFPLLDWTKIRHEPMTVEDFMKLQNNLTNGGENE